MRIVLGYVLAAVGLVLIILGSTGLYGNASKMYKSEDSQAFWDAFGPIFFAAGGLLLVFGVALVR